MKFLNVLLLFSAFMLTPSFIAIAQAENNTAANNASVTEETISNNSNKQDGEILAFINGVNNHEIKEANLALQKTNNSDIKEFAAMMIKDHDNSLKDTQAISESSHIVPIETAEIKKLQQQNDKEYEQLVNAKGKAFEKAYVQDMVKGHQQALTKIDSYLQSTESPIVKDYLYKLRYTVSMHLQHAKDLQAKINK